MRRSSISIGLVVLLLMMLPAVTLGLTVSLELDEVRVDRPAREVVVSGPVTCDVGTTGTITAVVIQGRREAVGQTALACTGTETTWEIRLPLGRPPLHPGPAILEFGFIATDGTNTIASGRSIEVFIAPR